MTRWDPEQYQQFGDARERPALDLLSRVPLAAPRRVVDLGCGTGAMARRMASRWPEADIVGLDRSPEMLEVARGEVSRVRWVEGDVATWVPEEAVDLLYSNAALHWVVGHDTLIPRLFEAVAPSGWLAIQMPLSFDLPSHRLMRTTLADGGVGETSLGTPVLRDAVARRWVDRPEEYLARLEPQAHCVDVWTTEALHVLEGPDPVFEWVKGTGLRPILQGLDEAERETFVDAYKDRLRQAYPPRSNGTTLFPFRRLFVVAQRQSI